MVCNPLNKTTVNNQLNNPVPAAKSAKKEGEGFIRFLSKGKFAACL